MPTQDYVDEIHRQTMRDQLNRHNTATIGKDGYHDRVNTLRRIRDFNPQIFQGFQDSNTDAKIKALNMVDFPPDLSHDPISQLGYQGANTRVEVPFGNRDQAIRLGADYDNKQIYGAYAPSTDRLTISENTVNSPEGQGTMRHELNHRAFQKMGQPMTDEQEHDVIYNNSVRLGYDNLPSHYSQADKQDYMDRNWSSNKAPNPKVRNHVTKTLTRIAEMQAAKQLRLGREGTKP